MTKIRFKNVSNVSVNLFIGENESSYPLSAGKTVDIEVLETPTDFMYSVIYHSPQSVEFFIAEKFTVTYLD